MDDRHPDSLTDPAIDREIRTVLDVEPSPEFLARVRTRIADEPVAPSFGWSWVFAGAVAAVLVLAVMVSVSRQGEGTADLKVRTTEVPSADLKVGTTEAPPADLKVGTTDAATTTSAIVPTFRSARSSARSTPRSASQEPEVLIAPDDVLAFQQFVAGIEERRFEISFDEPLPVAPTPQFTELTISPITIEPLEPIAVDEGVLQ